MKMLFAIRDTKADSFGNPMAIPTVGLAKRSFMEAVLSPNSELAKYKDDYILYQIGTYDPNSGRAEALKVPEYVMSASSVVEQANNDKLAVEPTLPGVVA